MKDAIFAWIRVILFGFVKILAKVTAPVAVLFVDRQDHPIWGVQDAIDLSYRNVAFRNGAHNLFTRQQVTWFKKSSVADSSMESGTGFQWCYRYSACRKYVSFRCVWGEPRPSKGKREFFIGWTLDDRPYMRLSFFQLRPSWPLFAALLAWYLLS